MSILEAIQKFGAGYEDAPAIFYEYHVELDGINLGSRRKIILPDCTTFLWISDAGGEGAQTRRRPRTVVGRFGSGFR